MLISPMTAACLTRRAEGKILVWIDTGVLPAHRDVCLRLQIDTADLLRVPQLSLSEQHAIRAYVADHCPITITRKRGEAQ